MSPNPAAPSGGTIHGRGTLLDTGSARRVPSLSSARKVTEAGGFQGGDRRSGWRHLLFSPSGFRPGL